jgi:hypothetical protein
MKKLLLTSLLVVVLPGAVHAQPMPPPDQRFYGHPYQRYPGYHQYGPGRIMPPYIGTLPSDREYNRDVDRYWSGPRGGPPPCVMYGTC